MGAYDQPRIKWAAAHLMSCLSTVDKAVYKKISMEQAANIVTMVLEKYEGPSAGAALRVETAVVQEPPKSLEWYRTNAFRPLPNTEVGQGAV